MSLEKDIESLVKSVDMELYEISTVSEFEETIYRIAVISTEIEDGKRKPVSLDACAELSRLISPLLDVTPPVSGDYRMEVGSPGIERKLKSIKNFQLSIGEKVKIGFSDRDKLEGTITKVEGTKIFVNVDDTEEILEFAEIAKAKTYFEW
ncbi:MAG: ribosome maturation factor [Campylobacterota bacterium]|nr:ribosome maturation factor [Campylobacterota bacterium]